MRRRISHQVFFAPPLLTTILITAGCDNAPERDPKSTDTSPAPSREATSFATKTSALSACVGVEEVGVPAPGFEGNNDCSTRNDPTTLPYCNLDSNEVTFEISHFSKYVLGAFENRPPLALCQDVTLETAPGTCSASGSVNAGSSDPDNDAITVTESPSGPFALGSTPVTLTAADAEGLSASCAGTITVVDREAPSLSWPAPITAECTANGSAMVDPGDALGTDNCPGVSVSDPGPSAFSLGTSSVSFTGTDASGNTSSCNTTVTVEDTTPPVVTVGASPELWPPDHRLEIFRLSDCQIAIEDACAGSLDLVSAEAQITCVSSDEPDDTAGDGSTTGDIAIVDAETVRLRAERQGGVDGRVYRVGFQVRDASQNQAAGTCVVRVAHDQSGVVAVDSGIAFSVCR